MKRIVGLLLLLLATQVQALTLAPAQVVGLQPKVGTALPAGLPLRDQSGQLRPLSGFYGGPPLLLVPTWYRCSNLCGTLLTGAFEGLRAAQLLPGRDYQLVAISIDPRETPADARQRMTDFKGFSDVLGSQTAWLTGPASALTQLQTAVGFHSQYDRAHDQYLHPATLIIADNQGVVRGYLPGVRFSGADLHEALARASRQAPPALAENTLSGQIALICSGFDVQVGRYSGVVFNGLRALALFAALGLGGWLWRRHRHAPRGAA